MTSIITPTATRPMMLVNGVIPARSAGANTRRYTARRIPPKEEKESKASEAPRGKDKLPRKEVIRERWAKTKEAKGARKVTTRDSADPPMVAIGGHPTGKKATRAN